MEDKRFYVLWSTPHAGIFKTVDGNIDFENGKAIFDATDGTHVEIDAKQISQIGIPGSMDLEKLQKKIERIQKTIERMREELE